MPCDGDGDGVSAAVEEPRTPPLLSSVTGDRLGMDEAQLCHYLALTDLPRQLRLRPDEAGLYLVYRHHVTRFPYQNVDLYRRHQAADLSVAGLLDYM